jgi:CheY-like chemotaxis protein
MQRILLVDDEEAILFAFSRVLRAPSVQLDTAQSAEEAVGMLGCATYGAVVADLRLAGMDDKEGLEVVRHAKAMQPKIYVIVITAYGGTQIRSEVFAAGADCYMEKPVSPQKIRDELQAHGVYGCSVDQ